MAPISDGGGKSQPGLKELRDEVRASSTQARLLTARALDQSLGAGDLAGGRKGGGREVAGERDSGTRGFLTLTTGQGVEKGGQSMRSAGEEIQEG